ncbi:MAG: hypothetical protein ACRCXT_10185 [Paraclostridium sp.]
MSLLKQTLVKELKIDKDLRTAVLYPTHFDEFDYRNGTLIEVTDMKTNTITETYPAVGIPGGTLTAVIGPSGSGKSSLAIQMACAIARPFKDTVIIHDDAENATSLTRLRMLSGMPLQWFKDVYVKRGEGVTTETFYSRVKSHHDLKMANYDALKYDTGRLDEFGEPLFDVVPSVYILDSLANMLPEKNLDEEGIGTNMTAAQTAKANSNIFRKIIPMLSRANIIMFVINHVGVAIQAMPMQPVKKQVNYLKQGESVPGGNTFIYLANGIIKVEAKAAFKEDDKYKIEGFPTKITIIKSRSNRAGQEMEFIYTQTHGFSQPMSKFVMAKEHGVATGSAFVEIPGYDKKFRNAEFITKYVEDEAFRNAFDKACEPVLMSFLSSNDDASIYSQTNWVDLLEASGVELSHGVSLKDLEA